MFRSKGTTVDKYTHDSNNIFPFLPFDGDLPSCKVALAKAARFCKRSSDNWRGWNH